MTHIRWSRLDGFALPLSKSVSKADQQRREEISFLFLESLEIPPQGGKSLHTETDTASQEIHKSHVAAGNVRLPL